MKYKILHIGILFILILTQKVSAQEKGFFIDERDNQRYITVTIGDQIWMADNLNFNHEKSFEFIEGDYPKSFGRLYTWNAAMASCPDGWRLPTKKEWDKLIETLGGKDSAGTELKSRSGLWNEQLPGKGSGFNAEPTGFRFYILYRLWYPYSKTFFWSSDDVPNSKDKAYGIDIHSGYSEVFDYSGYMKSNALSVRCIKK